MAISTPIARGTSNTTVNSTTVTVTTTGAIAAGSHAIVQVGWSGLNTDTVTISGGGVTWQTDKIRGTGSANAAVGLFSAYCPTGIASGTVITATISNTYSRKAITISEVAGLDSGSQWRLATGSGASATSTSGPYSDPAGDTTTRDDTATWCATCIRPGSTVPTWIPGSGLTAGQAAHAGTTTIAALFEEYALTATAGTNVTTRSDSTVASPWAFIWVEYGGASGTVTPGVAAATGAAPTPTLTGTLTAPLATATGAAVAATVVASILPATATGTGAAGVPTVKATLLVAITTATGTALVPLVGQGALPGTAVGTGSGLAPTLKSTLIATTTTGTGAAGAPLAQQGLTALVATGTGSAPVATIRLIIVAPSGLATGAALTPAAVTARVILTVVAVASGAAGVPLVGTGLIAWPAAGGNGRLQAAIQSSGATTAEPAQSILEGGG